MQVFGKKKKKSLKGKTDVVGTKPAGETEKIWVENSKSENIFFKIFFYDKSGSQTQYYFKKRKP